MVRVRLTYDQREPRNNNDIVEIGCKQSHYDALILYFTKKISRHQLSGSAVTTALSNWETRMKRNQGIISGKLSYQNGKTPAYLVFQAFAILFHKRNGNIATGKELVSWLIRGLMMTIPRRIVNLPFMIFAVFSVRKLHLHCNNVQPQS